MTALLTVVFFVVSQLPRQIGCDFSEFHVSLFFNGFPLLRNLNKDGLTRDINPCKLNLCKTIPIIRKSHIPGNLIESLGSL